MAYVFNNHQCLKHNRSLLNVHLIKLGMVFGVIKEALLSAVIKDLFEGSPTVFNHGFPPASPLPVTSP